MSWRLLISHHLFVAAVQDPNGTAPPPDSTKPVSPMPELRVLDIPLECVDFGRPAPVKTGWPPESPDSRRPT
jgi:hypothetical protein